MAARLQRGRIRRHGCILEFFQIFEKDLVIKLKNRKKGGGTGLFSKAKPGRNSENRPQITEKGGQNPVMTGSISSRTLKVSLIWGL